MIYLIQTTYYNETENIPIKLLKIGYTKDENKDIRYSQYKMHNPLFQVLYEISEGTEEQEKALHQIFSKYLYIGREWFRYSDEIVDYFKTHKNVDSLGDLVIEENLNLTEFKKEVKRVINLLINYKVSQGDITLENGVKQVDNLVNKILSDRRIKTKLNLWKYIEDTFGISISDLDSDVNSEVVINFLRKFEEIPYFTDKMRLLCESSFIGRDLDDILNCVPMIFKNYYITLGPDKIRNLQYKNSVLSAEYERIKNNQQNSSNLEELIYSVFQVGGKYLKSDIKNMLSDIYNKSEIKLTAKATDLEKYFEVRAGKITNKETGKRDHYYEILKPKTL